MKNEKVLVLIIMNIIKFVKKFLLKRIFLTNQGGNVCGFISKII